MATNQYTLSYAGGSKIKELEGQDTLLVLANNAVSFRESCGYNGAIHKMYPYGNGYLGRQQLFNLNRCVTADRPRPGTFILKNPPNSSLPTIACLITQYGAGSPIEMNEFNQRRVLQTVDTDFCRGLKEDTEANRILWCVDAVESLSSFLITSRIRNVIFPQEFAGTWMGNGRWSESYLPIIQSTAIKLKPHNIQTILYEKWWYDLKDGVLYEPLNADRNLPLPPAEQPRPKTPPPPPPPNSPPKHPLIINLEESEELVEKEEEDPTTKRGREEEEEEEEDTNSLEDYFSKRARLYNKI